MAGPRLHYVRIEGSIWKIGKRAYIEWLKGCVEEGALEPIADYGGVLVTHWCPEVLDWQPHEFEDELESELKRRAEKSE